MVPDYECQVWLIAFLTLTAAIYLTIITFADTTEWCLVLKCIIINIWFIKETYLFWPDFCLPVFLIPATSILPALHSDFYQMPVFVQVWSAFRACPLVFVPVPFSCWLITIFSPSLDSKLHFYYIIHIYIKRDFVNDQV